jgi:hypothetical protein
VAPKSKPSRSKSSRRERKSRSPPRSRKAFAANTGASTAHKRREGTYDRAVPSAVSSRRFIDDALLESGITGWNTVAQVDSISKYNRSRPYDATRESSLSSAPRVEEVRDDIETLLRLRDQQMPRASTSAGGVAAYNSSKKLENLALTGRAFDGWVRLTAMLTSRREGDSPRVDHVQKSRLSRSRKPARGSPAVSPPGSSHRVDKANDADAYAGFLHAKRCSRSLAHAFCAMNIVEHHHNHCIGARAS